MGQIRQIYSPTSIVTADEADMFDSEARTIIDLANLAQFGSWLVEGDLKACLDAHASFHTVFPGQMSDLHHDVIGLYLGLKTQLAIESIISRTAEQLPEDILNRTFVDGLEDELRALHGGIELTEDDQAFATSARLRKEALQGEVQNQADSGQFSTVRHWD